ncbi:hypothetical protein [Altibacter sp. HG106]|uniref:hypothetical protein n=1 Tax=Altibacter sp. HG106 TaxID=3023937 RepID=UPI0023506F03|nr:hypothetical protein [Altibacter sp. HG106]MDC7993613.1 hypothetical protein [Altibacter sp. HG106]
MKLIHRLGYYMGGFVIGILLLFFFLGGKRASCDYGPNARTLKNIRSKSRVYSEQALQDARNLRIDTHLIEKVLQSGDVLFSESITNRDSCNIYLVQYRISSERGVIFKIENCSKAAHILHVKKDHN